MAKNKTIKTDLPNKPQASTSAVAADDRPHIVCRKREDGVWLPPSTDMSVEEWERVASSGEWMSVMVPSTLLLGLNNGKVPHRIDLRRYANPSGVLLILADLAKVGAWNEAGRIKGTGRDVDMKRAAVVREHLNQKCAGARPTITRGDPVLRKIASALRGVNGSGIGADEKLADISEARCMSALGGEAKYQAKRKVVEVALAALAEMERDIGESIDVA